MTSLGHTAYHHVGLGYTPSPSSPYFLFGYQHRAPYNWAGGAGGAPWASSPAASTRELSGADLLESGLERGQYLPFSAFSRTRLHNIHAIGDWPLVRPAGYEPDDPHGDGALGLSDNEKRLGLVLAAVGLGWLLWKKMGKAGPRGSRRLSRRTRAFMRANPANPPRGRYIVLATAKPRGKKREYAGSFMRKRAAQEYAAALREDGHKAHVRKR